MPSIHELLNGQTLLIPPKVPKKDDSILQQQLLPSYGRIEANNNGQTLLIPPKASKKDDNILQQQLLPSYGRIEANNDSGINSSSSGSSGSISTNNISGSKDNKHDRLSSSVTWKGRFFAQEKRCEHCRVSASPEWRKGPSGRKK